MATIKLYHGTEYNDLESRNCVEMYFSKNIEDAREYGLKLMDTGSYNKKSYTYCTEIDDANITIIDDFMTFDQIRNDKNMPEIAYNPETDWFCIKKVKNIKLIESFENNLD